MKKKLLLMSLVSISITGFAQHNRVMRANKPIKSFPSPVIDRDAFPVANNVKPMVPLAQKNSSSACAPVNFTSSMNAFSVGGGVTTYQQNCLSYNKDLNAVVWIARVSADWSFSGKTSGAIQSTWLDISTNNWDSLILYRDSANGHGGRYPGGVLFNPNGNTAISGSQMVGSGPVTGGAGWLGVWYANRQPSGNFHATNIANTNSFCAAGTLPFGNVGNSSTNVGFLNLDMLQAGQNVLVSGALFDNVTGTDVKGSVIAHGNYSGGSFTWSADSLIPGFLNTAQGLISDGLGGRLAFGPTGQIGYCVFNGRLSTNYGTSADSAMMPIVYKSIDSGATWTICPASMGYDWIGRHPELLRNVGKLLPNAARHVTPNYEHGIDLVVDANGILHYVTTLTMPYKDGNYVGGGFDSLQYTYQDKWDYINNHPIIWDLMTDGTCWSTLFVDSVMTSFMGTTGDTTSAYNPWENGAGYLSYGAHLTVSRSTDGNIVFYGWGDSDPAVTGTPLNTQPDIIMKAFDVANNKVSATSYITNGIGLCFFSYLSDVSYFDNGTGKWIVPFVYTVGRVPGSKLGSYDATGPVDYFYGNCDGFAPTDIFIPASVTYDPFSTSSACMCMSGVKDQEQHFASVNFYPNPFGEITNVRIKLKENTALVIEVFDALGNLVYSKKEEGHAGENTFAVNGSDLTAGVYYCSVTTGYRKTGGKLVVQK